MVFPCYSKHKYNCVTGSVTPYLNPHLEPPESPDEKIPLLQVKKTKKPHPFVKMLFGIIPFGPSFRDLGILGKIYEIIKVIGRQVL